MTDVPPISSTFRRFEHHGRAYSWKIGQRNPITEVIGGCHYTVPSQSRMTLKGKTFVASPVMVVKVDEEAGEFISPDAMDLYRAAKFLDKHLSQITTKSGRVVPAFYLD